MAENSKIEWTSHTFNPWRGCTKVSAGCANCYAETLSGRNPGTLGVWGPNGTRVVASEAMWREPVKWNKQAACVCEARPPWNMPSHAPGCPQANRPRVFCASLADVFEDWTGPMVNSFGDQMRLSADGWTNEAGRGDGCPPLTMQDVRRRLFALIDATPNLDWLLLTKRPENILSMLPGGGWIKKPCPSHTQRFNLECPGCNSKNAERVDKARPNLWLGTSVENQAAADARIPHLLRVPAAVRFLSCEPLLGPVDLGQRLQTPEWKRRRAEHWKEPPVPDLDWVIVGGESGPGARPCRVEWIRSIVEQCKAAGVPCFVKQLGAKPHGKHNDNPGGSCLDNSCCELRLRDKKGGDTQEWPEELRVREFPRV